MEIKYCYNCGAKLPASAAFCSSCGVRQVSVDDATEVKAVTEKEKPAVIKECKKKKDKKPSDFNKKGLVPLIRNSVIMIVAIVMLVMAFMPVSKLSASEITGMPTDDIPELTMKVTPIRAISIMFSSFKSIDEIDLSEKLFEKIEDIYDEYDDAFEELEYKDWDDLRASHQDEILEAIDVLIYEAFKVGVSVENMSMPPQLYIAGAMSFAFIGAAVALFVLAVLNLLSTFRIIKSEGGCIFKWTVLILTLIPVMVIVLNFIYNLTFSSLGTSGANGLKMAGAAITSVVILSLVIVGLFVLRILFTKERSLSVMIRRGVALAVSIVVICLAFAPVIGTTVNITPFNSTSEREFKYSVYAPFLVSFGFLTDEEFDDAELLYKMDKYDKQDYITALIEDFENYTKKELSSVDGDILNTTVVTSLYFCYLGESMAIAPFLLLFQLIAVIGAGLVMWQMLRYFAYGKINRAFVLTGRLTAVIAGAFAVASAITLSAFLADATNKYAPIEFGCAISIGIFFFFAFAVAMLVLPISVKKDPEENCIPVSMFSKKAECGCCCESVIEEPVFEAAVSDEVTSDESNEEITEEDGEPDEQDIEDLKALDGDVE